MTLSDNGIGFDAQTADIGIGLKSMQERLEMINGRCIINSTPPKRHYNSSYRAAQGGRHHE